MKLLKVLPVLLGIGLVLNLGLGMLDNSASLQKVEYPLFQGPLTNPLMGWAPWATVQTIPQPHTLVYVDMTWREIEPEEGVFNFSEYEREQQLDRWREEGKRVVFRFVMDKPGDDTHLDIPDWLFEQIGQEGDFYSSSYGRGFSPNYSNPILIEKHKQIIELIGNRYGQDAFFAFIELGSLGHWGEWHVNGSAGIQPLPSEEIRNKYVQHYIEAFPNSKLLMRRPFNIAASEGLGLFNDMTGDLNSTLTWLDWIENGGDYDQTEEENGLSPMAGGWLSSPIGGEQSPSLSDSLVYGPNLAQTIELVRESHTTFIGPGGPYDVVYGGELQAGIDQVLSNIGYRFFIAEARMPATINNLENYSAKLEITLMNLGVAPFYFDWPVRAYLFDGDGTVISSSNASIDLREVVPLELYRFSAEVSVEALAPGKYTVGIAIIDPMMNQPAVRFANEYTRPDLIFELGTINITDRSNPFSSFISLD